MTIDDARQESQHQNVCATDKIDAKEVGMIARKVISGPMEPCSSATQKGSIGPVCRRGRTSAKFMRAVRPQRDDELRRSA